MISLIFQKRKSSWSVPVDLLARSTADMIRSKSAFIWQQIFYTVWLQSEKKKSINSLTLWHEGSFSFPRLCNQKHVTEWEEPYTRTVLNVYNSIATINSAQLKFELLKQALGAIPSHTVCTLTGSSQPMRTQQEHFTKVQTLVPEIYYAMLTNLKWIPRILVAYR